MPNAYNPAAAAVTADAMLAHWQGHRRLTRRMIEAFPDDKLFTYSLGGMRTFGELALEMLTMGAPHSSTAWKHCSGVSSFFNTWPGYWIFPHPAHARLQRIRGSSMRTTGKCLRRVSFCFTT